MQYLTTTAGAVASLQKTEYRRQATAERDVRWVLGLSACVIALLGWFRSGSGGVLPMTRQCTE
ncbi:MAG TPA: hypothetical protein VIK69_02445 [Methylophilaceae bacterium]|jgi:hypothetical protein